MILMADNTAPQNGIVQKLMRYGQAFPKKLTKEIASVILPRLKTPRNVGLLMMLVIALGGFTIFVLFPIEPNHHGKPLSGWISGLEYENVNPTDEQRTALRSMGGPAITPGS